MWRKQGPCKTEETSLLLGGLQTFVGASPFQAGFEAVAVAAEMWQLSQLLRKSCSRSRLDSGGTG